MDETSWVAEFMKSVGQSTFNDLIATLSSDIAECNELSIEAGQPHTLRLDEGEPMPTYARLMLEFRGGEHEQAKFFVRFDPPGHGAKIQCPYGKREITVLPRWDGNLGATVYEMDGRKCSKLSEVSRAILLPILRYPNYDWSDALKKLEESQG